MRFRAITAAVGAAVLASSAVPAYAATEPGQAPPTVQFSTARGDAPQLPPGIHQTTAPTGSTERYAAITRPKGGGVTVAIFGSVDAEMTTRDGENTCSDSVSLVNDVTGYTFVYVDPPGGERDSFQPDECSSATHLILQLQADNDSDSDSDSSSSSSTSTRGPLQFAVTVEPKLKKVGSPAPKAQQKEIRARSKTATGPDRTLSDRLFAPTTLAAGRSYPVTLTPGKPAVARVRVGWGQRLAASVDAPRNGSNFAPPQSLSLSVVAFSPQWVPVAGSGSTTLYQEESTEQTANVFTAPVNPGNRMADYEDAGDVGTSDLQWTTVAGWYYVVIRVDASDEDEKLTTRQLPARLNLRLVGAPSVGPTYVAANGSAQAAPPATVMSQGGSTDSGSSTGTILRVAGSALVLALAAGVVVLLLRRRRA